MVESKIKFKISRSQCKEGSLVTVCHQQREKVPANAWKSWGERRFTSEVNSQGRSMQVALCRSGLTTDKNLKFREEYTDSVFFSISSVCFSQRGFLIGPVRAQMILAGNVRRELANSTPFPISVSAHKVIYIYI